MSSPGRKPHTLAAAVVALLVTHACEADYSNRVYEVQLTGDVRVILFRDNNLSGGTFSAGDSPLRLAPVTLRRTASSVDARTLDTDSVGLALFRSVAPGRYRIELPQTVLGDSLLHIDAAREFTVQWLDTVKLDVGVRFASHSISEARSLPVGKKVFVRGIVLNAPGLFGDSTVHLADSVGAIRMSRVRPSSIQSGDSVQLLGVRSNRDGQPTYNVVDVLDRGTTDPLLPDSVSTLVAAAADGGRLDAALVRVFGAVIASATARPDGLLLTTSDGSGTLGILLSSNITSFNPLSRFTPGRTLTATGLLIPDPAQPGRWILRPRGGGEILVS